MFAISFFATPTNNMTSTNKVMDEFSKYALLVQDMQAAHNKKVGELELDINQAYLESRPPEIKNDVIGTDLSAGAYQAAIQRRLDRAAAMTKAATLYEKLRGDLRDLVAAHKQVLVQFFEQVRFHPSWTLVSYGPLLTTYIRM